MAATQYLLCLIHRSVLPFIAKLCRTHQLLGACRVALGLTPTSVTSDAAINWADSFITQAVGNELILRLGVNSSFRRAPHGSSGYKVYCRYHTGKGTRVSPGLPAAGVKSDGLFRL